MQATDFLKLSRAQITTVNFDLPDGIFCEISVALVSSGGYPVLKPKLRFIRSGRQDHEIIFDSKAPLEPLKGLKVEAQDLFAVYNRSQHGPQYASTHAMERVANRAYTPLVKLELRRHKPCDCSSNLWVELKIGDWYGSQNDGSLYYLCTR